MGTVYSELELYLQAISYFEESLAIDKDKITTLNGLAFTQLKFEYLVLAESFYDDVLGVDDTNFDTFSGLLLIYIGVGT